MRNIIWILILMTLISCQVKDNQKKEELKNNALTKVLFMPEDNGYELIWEDDFNGVDIDRSKWEHRHIGPRRIGFNDSTMISVKDGCVHLSYDIKGDSVLGCMLGTQGTFQTTYGYFECRAKLQNSNGPWAAFWLQSPRIFDGPNPAIHGTEIDIFEYFKGFGADTLTHCLHWAYGPNLQSHPRMDSYLEGLSEGFHTFALEWTPEKYVFYIDGLKFHETLEAISHIDQYIILSMEIPPRLEGIKQAYAPDTFSVDYVKVYKKIN